MMAYRIAFGDSYTYVQGARGYVNPAFIGGRLGLSYTPRGLLADFVVRGRVSGWPTFWLWHVISISYFGNYREVEGGPDWVEYPPS